MTKTQQAILLVIVAMLLGVTALLAYTLLTTSDKASEAPTLAVLITFTAPPPSSDDAATAVAVPPTWTPEPTRTPPATNTPRATATATSLPTISPTFAPTLTPKPTEAVTPGTPGSTGSNGLENAGFDGVRGDNIPGWSWWADDNYTPTGPYNPDSSYDTPLFKRADDPLRFITGSTLQVDATQHLKFKVHIFQTVAVTPTVNVGFQVMAGAFSDTGAVQMAAGIDPAGAANCSNARWSEVVFVDQAGGVRPIAAPEVVAGDAGQVTVCLYAEPQFAAVSNAAFFDDAELTIGR